MLRWGIGPCVEIAPPTLGLQNSGADSYDAAQAYRFDADHRNEMKPQGSRVSRQAL